MVKSSVLAAALAIFLTTAGPSRAQFGPTNQSANAQSGGPQSSRACAVLDVSVFTDRVHVRCGLLGTDSSGYQGQIVTPENYYAVATNDPFAPIFATVATAAQQARKTLTIIFLNDPAQNPPGCQPSDCRAVVGARFIP